MGRLALLFIGLPAVELFLLVAVGKRVGVLPTLGIIVLTGVVGAALARWQGGAVLRKVRDELLHGRLPAKPMVEGAILLVAAVLLMTPGILTDLAGLLCLIPPVRQVVLEVVWKRIERSIDQRRLRVVTPRPSGPRTPPGLGPIIDVEPERPDDERGN